jgi:uncharacterized membrane protein (DUF2068 family)
MSKVIEPSLSKHPLIVATIATEILVYGLIQNGNQVNLWQGRPSQIFWCLAGKLVLLINPIP